MNPTTNPKAELGPHETLPSKIDFLGITQRTLLRLELSTRPNGDLSMTLKIPGYEPLLFKVIPQFTPTSIRPSTDCLLME